MNRRKICSLVSPAILALFLLVPSCSDDGGSPANGGSGVDTQPPKVVAVVPENINQVRVQFDETVHKASAERVDYYAIVEAGSGSAPTHTADRGDDVGQLSAGDSLDIATVTLRNDGKSVLITTTENMQEIEYSVYVKCVRDVRLNKMTKTDTTAVTGSVGADQTPPSIVGHSPSSGAVGVGVGESVVIQFSEPMDPSTVYSAFNWSWSSGLVSYSTGMIDGSTFVFQASQPLQTGTRYVVSVTSAAEDLSGNAVAAKTWNYTTISTNDVISPMVIATSPGQLALDVSVNTTLSITFSEAINPVSIFEDEAGILITPSVEDGILTWTNGGTKLVFTPDAPLMDDTQYVLTIPKGAVSDLAGNPLAETSVFIFTTGSTLSTGVISGIIAGDPSSLQAANPVGTIAIAGMSIPFEDNEDIEMKIMGADVANSIGEYVIPVLPDGWYYPWAILDSNNDGQLEPMRGDAFGVYGADVAASDFTIDSVQVVSGGAVNDVDFPLFDPVAIAGTVEYTGTAYVGSLEDYDYYVGVFDTTGFDPLGELPSPLYVASREAILFNPHYVINQLEHGLMPGTYYVGAFLDVNFNGDFDSDTDPQGSYGEDWLPVTVGQGVDRLEIDIELQDPDAGQQLNGVVWRAPVGAEKKPREFARIRALLESGVGKLNGR